MIKNYLLDTNILLQSPSSIFGFDDNVVWLCGTTLQELDAKKSIGGDVGYSARECIRILDDLRTQGDLVKGVKLENGGVLKVEPDGVDEKRLPKGFSISVPDNRIISSCLYLNERFRSPHTAGDEPDVILVTNDISMRINASICGLMVQSYHNDHITESGYKGHVDINVEKEMIDDIFHAGAVTAGIYKKALIENEFVTLHCGNQSALSIYHVGEFHVIKEKQVCGVAPLNKLQAYALYALTAPVDEIALVILEGPAGTAKTFLSLAAGLDGVYRDTYEKVLISRNNVTSDADFGFLPGEMDNKSAYLVKNFTDALTSIVRGRGEVKEQVQMQVKDLLSTSIEFAPMAYMRGRSLTDSFLIFDEAQNATKSQIRDVITRAGAGCKVVCAGDIHQIDAPTLDKRNNGLSFAANRMVGEKVAYIAFSEEDCQRSKIAQLAIKKMDL